MTFESSNFSYLTRTSPVHLNPKLYFYLKRLHPEISYKNLPDLDSGWKIGRAGVCLQMEAVTLGESSRFMSNDPYDKYIAAGPSSWNSCCLWRFWRSQVRRKHFHLTVRTCKPELLSAAKEVLGKTTSLESLQLLHPGKDQSQEALSSAGVMLLKQWCFDTKSSSATTALHSD